MPPAEPDASVPIPKLLAFAERLLRRLDVPADDARLTAHILLQADLRGIESHGMAHLVDFYVRRIQQGAINPRPEPRVTSEAPSAATIDGDRGLGFVVGHRAMQLAIDKAAETGVGIVTVANSTHYGAGAYYGMMALDREMIGLSMTTGGKLLVPPGGRERAIGTNVLSMAAPAPRGFPYVLDMATTVVAAGKLEIAIRRGRTIPEGWALDAEGNALSDAAQLRSGALLLPLGGSATTGAYKGFGLAMMVDILCGALSGFGTSAVIEPRTAAHCFGALRIDAFGTLDEYLRRTGELIDRVKESAKADGVAEITIAGELEHRLAQERRAADAVPLHPAIIHGFRDAAEELDVPFDLLEEV